MHRHIRINFVHFPDDPVCSLDIACGMAYRKPREINLILRGIQFDGQRTIAPAETAFPAVVITEWNGPDIRIRFDISQHLPDKHIDHSLISKCKLGTSAP